MFKVMSKSLESGMRLSDNWEVVWGLREELEQRWDKDMHFDLQSSGVSLGVLPVKILCFQKGVEPEGKWLHIQNEHQEHFWPRFIVWEWEERNWDFENILKYFYILFSL